MEPVEVINGIQWFEMLVVAKSMENTIGRTRLFALLREEKIMMEGNIPYQPYVDSKCFKIGIKPRRDKNNTVVQSYVVPLVSLKGIELIKKIVNKTKKETTNEEK